MYAARFIPKQATASKSRAYHHAAKSYGSLQSSRASPMVGVPTGFLLRSFLIGFVSSKSILLSPTLYVLSALSKKSPDSILNVDRNPIFHFILKHTLFKQFCAGETGLESRETMRRLRETGFGGTILTYAKETIFDFKTGASYGLGTDATPVDAAAANTSCPDIDAWKVGTLETLNLLGPSDHLAVKVTGAGSKVTEALTRGEEPPSQMMDAMHDICKECQQRQIRILIDAESQHFQRGIAKIAYEMSRIYNRDGHAVVYNTYQSYLKGTRQRIIKDLHKARDEGYTLGLKLVRGAYLASDQRDLIHATKKETDDNYNTIARGVINQNLEGVEIDPSSGFPPVNLLLATHNKESALSAYQLHKDRVALGLPTIPLLFAQLHGMCDHLSLELIQMQDGNKTILPQVLKCSTWGTLGECLAYLLRRAEENRQAAARSREELDTLRDEIKRRIASWVLMRDYTREK